MYHILSSIVCTFFIENDAEILPAHYTWKVAFANLIHKQSIQVKLYNEGVHCSPMHTLYLIKYSTFCQPFHHENYTFPNKTIWQLSPNSFVGEL